MAQRLFRPLIALFALLAFAGRADAEIIDRTNEPRPLVISGKVDMSKDVLIDNNLSRPAVIMLDGSSFKLGYGYREVRALEYLESDPGLGETYDGEFLPKLSIGFSHHDFARSFITAHGKVNISIGQLKATCGINIVANPDGSYGDKSRIYIGKLWAGKQGILASGQSRLSIAIKEGYLYLWKRDDIEGPGHLFYANESRKSDGTYLRLLSPKVRIGKARGIIQEDAAIYDNVTAKFKGSWDIDYECLDDQNPCGAFDQYGASGKVHVRWSHHEGSAYNPIFLGFRIGGNSIFGTPNGILSLDGILDASNSPNQSVPIYRWETKATVNVTVKGGAEPVIWAGAKDD